MRWNRAIRSCWRLQCCHRPRRPSCTAICRCKMPSFHGWIRPGRRSQRVWVLHEGVRLLARYAARGSDIPRGTAAGQAVGRSHARSCPQRRWRHCARRCFCPSDRFGPFVQDRFGHLSGGAMIAAMRDWVAGNLRYVPGASDAATTALDTFVTRQGVCRDYAHFALCLCPRRRGCPRAMFRATAPA